MKSKKLHIVIIGGGAGGLELVARLCQQFKKNKLIKITLIDNQLKHVWKPLLHQVAAGTYLSYQDEIDYFSYAYQKGFNFIFGSIQSIDRKNKNIFVRYLGSAENNIPHEAKKINYDLLIIAVGSQSNDFGISGVKEHCLLLDSLYQAENFNKLLIQYLIKIAQGSDETVKTNIAIVGGGATGIELAAELNHVLLEARKYKNDQTKSSCFKLTIVEAGSQILNTMPERISKVIMRYLNKNDIDVLTNTQITKVNPDGLWTADEKFINAQIIIWAAGVKANLLPGLNDLEVNKINQIVVNNKLQTTQDENIFAFGDCASCPQPNHPGKLVPPRAQAAHQQAKLLAKSLKNYLDKKPLLTYHYKDYGSLITLSRYNVVGNLMTNIAKNFYIEGLLAQFAYWLLYKKHLMILKGVRYVILSVIADFIIKKQKPEIKLH